MRRIKKRGIPTHFANWKNNFISVNGRDPLYDDLIGTAEYGKLKKELLKEQGYICCYCERLIGKPGNSDCDIEHFKPRHPDKNKLTPAECACCRRAQLDYDNLFVSCMGEEQDSTNHCNHKKDNWYDFDCCISPASEEIEGIFGFRLNGKIFAVNSNLCAEEMRSHLNLDSYVLRQQRKNAYDAVLEQEFSDDELLNDDDYISDTIEEYQEADENGRYEPFCSMITYCLSNYLLGK